MHSLQPYKVSPGRVGALEMTAMTVLGHTVVCALLRADVLVLQRLSIAGVTMLENAFNW